ncbi:MAG TPA: hypothetical protein PKZ32_14600, partial [Candidatus Melainabacteria bacterium]|nr:hypothetical protein [Candidatus Melainabacteria bacterium]
AGLCAGWALLTAFQMAFFYYLYFAGPIMAGLWAWPTRMFQQAFPTWVESCVTLAFWSFLWQITICLLAMTKAQASTGLYMVTALNVLATTSVKHAFDCAAIMKSAVQQCEMIGSEVAAAAESGGGGGGGKGGGKGGKKGGSSKGSTPANAPAPVGTPAAPVAAQTPAAAAAPVITHDDEGNLLPKVQVPKILKPSIERTTPESTPVRMAELPPAARVPATPAGPQPGSFSVAADPLNGTFYVDPAQNPFRGATPDPAGTTCTLNNVTGVWNDPVCSAPPAAGRSTAPLPRNTIGSVLGNSIQNVMHYPANIPHQDPDLVHLQQVKANTEATSQQAQATLAVCKVEEKQEVTVTKDISPSSPEQESVMNSNEDPRIAALRNQRFNYPPPPMVSGQPAAGFAKVPSGAALTPQQLLSKLQTVAEANSYAPPPPPVDAPPLTGFSAVPNSQQSFEPQRKAVDLQGQNDGEQRQPNLNEALGHILRQRGAWAQAETPVKPAVPQTLSNGWWS